MSLKVQNSTIMRLIPARRIKGSLRLPGDKSISHRAALIEALSTGRWEISNFSTGRDCGSTIGCLQDLGISIEKKQGKLIFAGGQELTTPNKPLDCGNSGSTLRILSGVLAGHELYPRPAGARTICSRPPRARLG